MHTYTQSQGACIYRGLTVSSFAVVVLASRFAIVIMAFRFAVVVVAFHFVIVVFMVMLPSVFSFSLIWINKIMIFRSKY